MYSLSFFTFLNLRHPHLFILIHLNLLLLSVAFSLPHVISNPPLSPSLAHFLFHPPPLLLSLMNHVSLKIQ